jgi:hypothetical protein
VLNKYIEKTIDEKFPSLKESEKEGVNLLEFINEDEEIN